jgi:hypothetical protein
MKGGSRILIIILEFAPKDIKGYEKDMKRIWKDMEDMEGYPLINWI